MLRTKILFAHKTQIRLWVLLLWISFSAFFAPTAQAQIPAPSVTAIPNQAAMNLTLSPVSLALEAEPGTTVTTTIKVRNNSSTAENLRVSFGSFTADESGEKPKLLDPGPGQEYLQWMTADPGTFTANPGEWTNIKLTFSPPASAGLGYYYAVYISREQQQVNAGETMVQGSPAILVLATVKSPYTKRQLELSSFSVTQPWSEYLPQTFQVTIKNTGNIHVVPIGNIFIDGQGKKDLAVLSLNPSASAVLPQSARTFSVTWYDGFPVKTRTDKIEQPASVIQFASLDWDIAKVNTFRYGSYTAHLLLAYDNGERDVPIESFVNFWIIPWKLMLAGLLVILLAVIGLTSIVRTLWKKIRSLTATKNT